MKEVRLGEESIKKVLINSGLTGKEAEIYMFLARNDALTGTEVAKILKKDNAQVFRILKKLRAKGFLESTMEFPARHIVVPFENILDRIIKIRQEEIALIQKSKVDLLTQLKKKSQTELDTSLERFVVIKGNKRIYSKINQIIQKTKHQLSIATTLSDLIRADRFGVLDVAFNHPLRSQISYRFLTELSEQNLNALKSLLERSKKTDFNLKSRNPNLGLKLFPRMVARDNEEILFFTKPRTEKSTNDEVCLWTNSKSLVQAFGAIFEELWRNSRDTGEKIAEIDAGKSTPKTCAMTETDVAQYYSKMLQLATEDIILITSSKGLIKYSNQGPLIEKWKNSGVHVKIMAPIVRENAKEVQQLQKTFEVRHIPENYIETTIVDGEHLFQFKTPPMGSETLESIPNLENTLYTNELEYVEKMKTTLNNIWKNATRPPAVTLEAIIGSFGPILAPLLDKATLSNKSVIKITDIKPPGTITEKEVLDKIIHANKIMIKDPLKDFSKMYASSAIAAINPPDSINVPKILIAVNKIEKQSTYGAEDNLTIFLWLPRLRSTGHAYVPVAAIGDNPKSQQQLKALFAGTPAGQNVQLVRKDELQVRVHGNTMFAGWTVTIPLYPKQYILPPSCLLIEGHGNVRTHGFTILHSSGFKSKIEENYFDAFVTFIHPSSKYSGPGTDGVFARDYIMTNFPPKLGNRQQE
jgi:sugar-specific transcriptional regulator TrmB